MDSSRQSIVYNRYATIILTNPVILSFSRYQNVNLSYQRDNSIEYQKRTTYPENTVFSGVSLSSDDLFLYDFNSLLYVYNEFLSAIEDG